MHQSYIQLYTYIFLSLGFLQPFLLLGSVFFTFGLKAAPLLPFFPTLLEQQVNMNVSWTAQQQKRGPP